MFPGRRVFGPSVPKLVTTIWYHIFGKYIREQILAMPIAILRLLPVYTKASTKGPLFTMEISTKHWKRYVHCIDRKSTRLNSSHVKISYAVFCLKKKTT